MCWGNRESFCITIVSAEFFIKLEGAVKESFEKHLLLYMPEPQSPEGGIDLSEKKTGLVMEGGAFRGLFTCGVIDVMMEHGITYDGAIGVSAGATFGCNYKSCQIGRAYRYNVDYCSDKRYGSFRNVLRGGDFFDEEFCYHEIPYVLYPFDTETFKKNPMEFYVVCTDVVTGKPVYRKIVTGLGNELEWIRASASMPLVSRLVEVDGYRLLDGGMADSIPVKWFRDQGYKKSVVILTQPEGFVKKPNKAMPLIRRALKNYPRAIETMEHRHIRYNQTLAYLKNLEERGEVLVIRPPEALNISSTESDPAEMERVYRIGRAMGERYLEEVREFLDS